MARRQRAERTAPALLADRFLDDGAAMPVNLVTGLRAEVELLDPLPAGERQWWEGRCDDELRRPSGSRGCLIDFGELPDGRRFEARLPEGGASSHPADSAIADVLLGDAFAPGYQPWPRSVAATGSVGTIDRGFERRAAREARVRGLMPVSTEAMACWPGLLRGLRGRSVALFVSPQDDHGYPGRVATALTRLALGGAEVAALFGGASVLGVPWRLTLGGSERQAAPGRAALGLAACDLRVADAASGCLLPSQSMTAYGPRRGAGQLAIGSRGPTPS